MRRAVVAFLLVSLLCAACSSGPAAERAAEPDPAASVAASPPYDGASGTPPDPASAAMSPACTGGFGEDIRRLKPATGDELLRCAAEVAVRHPEYRTQLAFWLLVNRDTYPDAGKPGYRAFVQTTRWRPWSRHPAGGCRSGRIACGRRLPSRHRCLERFAGNLTPMQWEEMIVPPWLDQPWRPYAVVLVTQWLDRPILGHPDAGTPQLFYRLPEDAEPVSLICSPRGLAYAVVELRDSGLEANVLRSLQDDSGPRFRLPLETPLLAVSDDAVTTVTVSDATVTAENHLTGDRVSWRLQGEILNVRLTGSALLVVQADRVMGVPYRLLNAD